MRFFHNFPVCVMTCAWPPKFSNFGEVFRRLFRTLAELPAIPGPNFIRPAGCRTTNTRRIFAAEFPTAPELRLQSRSVSRLANYLMLLDTPVCDFGWKAADFTLPDLDDRKVSFTQNYGANGLLVAFICNHCPYVKAVIDRLVADATALAAEGINTLAVMPNDFRAYPDDRPDKMKAFAAEHKFPFPYLLDEDQAVARAYAAVCTPDFFGFNHAAELQYRGRLDDAGMKAPAARKTELLDAMRLVAETGKGPDQQTPSMGCSIKWRA